MAPRASDEEAERLAQTRADVDAELSRRRAAERNAPMATASTIAEVHELMLKQSRDDKGHRKVVIVIGIATLAVAIVGTASTLIGLLT